MDAQFLSALSRGRGYKGHVHDDLKPKYPVSVPYFLRDVSQHKIAFPPLPNEKKFRTLPGTYLTDKGQMILYTKAKKSVGLEKEAAQTFKKMSKFYDMVQIMSNEFKEKDICEARKDVMLGDLKGMAGSLKNDWFFPKKWNSPAKEFIPKEAIMNGYDIKEFLKNKNPSLIRKSFQKNMGKSNSNSLPGISSSLNNKMSLQRQNNAINSSSNTTETITRSISGNQVESECTLDESLNGTEDSLNSVVCSSSESFYDVEEEFLIQRSSIKNKFYQFDDKELFNIEDNQINLKDVLGGDTLLSDIKTMDINSIVRRQSKSSKNEKNEDLRVYLLKNLYEKLNFLSLAKHHLKTYSEGLLRQFLNYNSENRKRRLRNLKEELYKTFREMKERNDEIKVRIQNISEKKILEKKDSVDKNSFNKEWDQMLVDLSIKSKYDLELLEVKKQKLLHEEELKVKGQENTKLDVENSAILFAFTTLRNELTKLEEDKHDIEHFIIRLEMGRENVLKIEREISTVTPPPFTLSKRNFQSYFNKIKEETVINWQIKMYDFGKDFKVEESKLIEMLTSDCELDSSAIKDNGDINSNTNDKNINANTTEKNVDESKNILTSVDSGDLMLETNKSQSFSNSQKNYLMKLDYEQMKMDQRISANHTYSYFIPWPRENYERDYISSKNLSDSEEEKEKPPKVLKLNYKRILAHNPLKEKLFRKNRKKKL